MKRTFTFLLFYTLVFSQNLTFKLVETESQPDKIYSWYFSSESEDNFSPKIIVQSDQIRLPDHQTLQLPSGYLNTFFSNKGEYFGIMSLQRNHVGRAENDTINLEIFSHHGKSLYQIQSAHYFDEPFPAVKISDKDGSTVLAHSGLGRLWFYEPNGNQLEDIELFIDDEYALERYLQMDMSDNGQFISVSTNKKPASPLDAGIPNPSGEPHLFLFTIRGKKVWQRQLHLLNASNTSISPDGSYIAACSYRSSIKEGIEKNTSIFDRNGNRIATYNTLFRTAKYSDDSRYVILADKNSAVSIELPIGTQNWEYKISEPYGMITAVDIAHNANFSVLLVAKNEFRDGDFIYINPRLIILNSFGQKIQQFEATKDFYKPALTISEDQKYIGLGFQNGYEIYEAVIE